MQAKYKTIKTIKCKINLNICASPSRYVTFTLFDIIILHVLSGKLLESSTKL